MAQYYLLGDIGNVPPHPLGGFSPHYLDVVDTNGVPLWWYDNGYQVGDAKVLANGDIAWLPWGGPLGLTERGLDGSLVNSVQVPDNPPVDLHDFEPLPNGDWLVASYAPRSGVDLSSIGGPSNGCIVDAEVEEVTPAGAQVWSWFASQHLSPSEINTDIQPTVAASTCASPADAWHLNSLQPLGSHFLVSLRYSGVYEIDQATGSPAWRLGESTSTQGLTISGDPLGGFLGQHDARMWADGTVSIFDNGSDSATTVHPARMVRYRIDSRAGTATMVQQIRDPNITNSSLCCGSARQLPNGHWAIGYGFQGVNTEVTASGSRVLSLNFDDPSIDPAHPDPTMFSYRMTPVLPGTLSRTALRAGMDAMNPVADTQPPSVVTNAADNACSRPGNNGWCRGPVTAGFDAFDDTSGVASVCGANGLLACEFTVTTAVEGSAVTVPSGTICDLAPLPNCTSSGAAAVAGPFRIDSTPPRISATAKTADGRRYMPGTVTHQAVTVHFTCSDTISGIATHGCPANVTVANPSAGGRVVEGAAQDKAGNRATTSVAVGNPPPDAPRNVGAIPIGGRTARVTWHAPLPNGGSHITAFVVTPFLGTTPQAAHTVGAAARSVLITGLTNSKRYTFSVAAKNAGGTGSQSTPSAPITIGAPGPPTNVNATSKSSTALKVTFTAPPSNGAPITRYTATCTSPNGTTRRDTGAGSPLVVAQLTAGKTYTCAVTATNSRGTGPPSRPSPGATA